MWRVKFKRTATKDARRIAAAGLKPKVQELLEFIGETPLLDLQMRLGEGTGAALAMTLIEAAAKLFDEMATFSSAGVSEASA